ncbi:Serine/threonine protein kinase [Streptomyces zhaozhouensis]|uniref:non-specific serine/threonine protein kinase n=1 Tax=Streptomyces zhaozhouensis TaxID=1300267 RepID=A0A286DUC7_9ACTN|nr:serine/threonine-protein kinase [Streptomyces zhaozhouensis]SOD62262.1 Serine/threonine protein kinase [Streptomyces zhaozhouensis]
MRPGDELAGKYVLREVIGRGRGGHVWRAHDRWAGGDVALKPGQPGAGGALPFEASLGEPRALAKFRGHPHVVTLLNVVEASPDAPAGTSHWLVLEYMPGGGLDRGRLLPPEEAARVGAQLADALAALHEGGIVHCDVKPANVGRDHRGTAKLLDFGAAYRFRDTATVTVNGPFSFTPDYAAPEMAKGHIPRPASDVFSLAATVHALVTGAPPRGDAAPDDATTARTGESRAGEGRTEEDDEALRRWRAEQGVVRVDTERVGPLAPVLEAMLRRDPGARPDAAEAGRLLAAVAGEESTSGARTAGPGPDATTGEGPPSPRRRWPWAVGAAGAAALLAALLVVVDGGGDDAEEPAAPTAGEAGVIGDPRTADLCALVDVPALSQLGDVRVDTDFGNFDQCEVILNEEGGGEGQSRVDVSLQVRPGAPPEASRVTREIGGLAVVPGEPAADECRMTLVPPGAEEEERVLLLRATEEDDPVAGGAAMLCNIADTAARGVAAVLAEGAVPRLPAARAEESLVWESACGLVDREALAAVPELVGDEPEVGLMEWSCEWADDDSGMEAKVSFHRDQPDSLPDGEWRALNGYDTLIAAGNEPETCSAFVAYREYGGQDADTYAETVRLYVRGPRAMDELCGGVTELATQVSRRLPPAG